MRLLLFTLGISVGVVGIGNRADAQNYPWCALYRDARPLAAEMVGSAYKIIPTSRHPDYIHRQRTKGAISINAHTFPNSSDSFARWPLSTRAGGLRFHPHKFRLRAWLDYLSF